ncbi:hypothetical protein COL10_16425 [Bacillus cereus]|uniref:hypothetical protein n=1 Tax=Bacillus cereus TaxID=1396 RepID=UPI000BF64995|nr:hypothetical protein [Bacillus cereus]PFV09966.1 hypothetical protein COL10_16425 [Bacillus cereus]
MYNQKKFNEKERLMVLDEGMPWRHLPKEELDKVTKLFQEFNTIQNPGRKSNYQKQALSDFNLSQEELDKVTGILQEL